MPKHKLSLILILILLIVSMFVFGVKSGITLEKIQAFIDNLGVLAPIAFILIYMFGPVFFMPITPMSITAGVLFGPVWGTVYTLIGATLAALTTFLLSRYLVKDFIDKKSPEKVAMVQNLVSEGGWKFVAIARVNPIFPFNVQNYIFGVTNIPLKTFILASSISLIPGSFAYVYLGHAGKLAMSGSTSLYSLIITIASVIIFLSLIPLIVKKIKFRQECK